MVDTKLWTRLDYAMLVCMVVSRLRVSRFDKRSAEDLYFGKRQVAT